MAFDTNNALPDRNGLQQVHWRYHTAPVIRLADSRDQFYILDPAISAEPILRDDWYQMMVNSRALPGHDPLIIKGKVTCHSDTLTPIDNCFDPDPKTDYDDFDTMLDEETHGFLEK